MPWRETPEQLDRARAERAIKVAAPDGELFGILTPAGGDGPHANWCAVHLTRPRCHRNRNWIEIGRTLAARGLATFRFDYHGTGDSGGDSGYLNPNHPYQGDLAAVIDHLRTLGYERFVLTGSCFDARTALSAFETHGDRIEALLFVAAPVTSIEDQQRLQDQGKDWGHVWRALQNPENWRRLRDLDRWRHMANVLGRVAGRGAREGAKEEPAAAAPAPPDAPPLDPAFRRHLDALVRSRARALFLYGEDDPEFLGFQIALRDLWATFPDPTRARLAVEVWPGVVHSGFIEMTRQREILGRALEWLTELVENPGTAERDAHRAAAHRPVQHRPEGTWTSA
jgi:pimeloyl-ACP methyl ester carboxylesterase